MSLTLFKQLARATIFHQLVHGHIRRKSITTWKNAIHAKCGDNKDRVRNDGQKSGLLRILYTVANHS